MSVLKKARRIRSRLLINAIFQIIAAAGLAAAALSVRSAPMILLITFALAVGVGLLAKRTLDRRAKYGPQDKAERVLLGLCPELEAHGFGIARRGRLPEVPGLGPVRRDRLQATPQRLVVRACRGPELAAPHPGRARPDRRAW